MEKFFIFLVESKQKSEASKGAFEHYYSQSKSKARICIFGIDMLIILPLLDYLNVQSDRISFIA
ncbi:hypothetical protein Syun_001634 [Stephania yunnanensis]|uniref:Uncharacterized protein n=1 Tax=Stephania yunnanensis TaxID=152371 RepID=A0AAP0Q7Y7_9MAGN